MILFLIIGIDYYAGLQIFKVETKKKKRWLILSIVSNLSILALFKYYNFGLEQINSILRISGFEHQLPLWNLILPIGLSFHTFQSISYTIEIYRGNVCPERHLGIYAVYVLFFPQLVAGPIERPQNIIPQFRKKIDFNHERFITGIHRILWGLFKKAVVADLLGKYVNSIYDFYGVNNGATFWVASWAFGFQIYCDFSGYSDIALGSARILGFDLMENFNLPFFAKSISEFWRRWHISLSTWLRDYLYIPLGGNKKSKIFTYRNLFITMTIAGLWHGAAWNYVLWGISIGLLLISERILKSFIKKEYNNSIAKPIQVFIVFQIITLTWVLFRSETWDQILYIYHKMLSQPIVGGISIKDTSIFVSMILMTGIMVMFEFFFLRKRSIYSLNPIKHPVQSLSFIVTFTMLLIWFSVSDGDQFIYFQF
ncbi:MAG: MBOAT family protein [Flavobacteriales bacterium]|nr:MBOAT family protein [Flavobacteriales bacterium]